jgi:hypothetical protein
MARAQSAAQFRQEHALFLAFAGKLRAEAEHINGRLPEPEIRRMAREHKEHKHPAFRLKDHLEGSWQQVMKTHNATHSEKPITEWTEAVRPCSPLRPGVLSTWRHAKRSYLSRQQSKPAQPEAQATATDACQFAQELARETERLKLEKEREERERSAKRLDVFRNPIEVHELSPEGCEYTDEYRKLRNWLKRP